MLYTVAQAQYGIVILGSIPQFELNALLSVWQPQYQGQLRGSSEIAEKLGYSIVLGTQENLEKWAVTLGISEVPQDEPEEVADVAESS